MEDKKRSVIEGDGPDEQEPESKPAKHYTSKKEYRTSKWAGLTNYECPYCRFSNLDKNKVDAHIYGAGKDNPPTCLHGPFGPWEPIKKE